MSDEICIWFGEDGKAHAYNSEFDVTIHCTYVINFIRRNR